MRGLMAAVNLATFPVLYFCTFLYYTDAGSVFFVLFMYLLSLNRNHVMAAMLGGCAVMMRQTNIVWVLFVCGTAAASCISNYLKCPETMDKDNGKQLTEQEYFDHLVSAVRNSLRNHKKSMIFLVRQVAFVIWPYVILIVGFIAFVIYNGGFVVGDRNSHRACLYVPQFFYLCLFTMCFAFPFMISYQKLKSFHQFLHKHTMFVVIVGAAMALSIWYLTYAHPYLLADNRHYPFYIWRKVFMRHDCVKYVLIPVYIYALWCCYTRLHYKVLLWKLVFLVSCLLATVPQKLVEFRYFILPYLMFRLHMRNFSLVKLSLELALYTAVNTVTIKLFLEKPFQWPDVSGSQRFMW